MRLKILLNALVGLLIWGMTGLSIHAQTTLEIPREQIEAIEDIEPPEFNPDLSTMKGMIDAFDEASQLDVRLPEALVEAIKEKRKVGVISPMEDHTDIVWAMQAEGSWNERMSGTGTLSTVRLDRLRGDAGRQVMATLDSEEREWAFHVATFIPDKAPPVVSRRFTEAVSDLPGAGATGIYAFTNHMFNPVRIVGYATEEGMKTPGFSDPVEEYLYTEASQGRIRIEEGEGESSYRLSFTAEIIEYHSEETGPGGKPVRTGRVARISGWICDAASHRADPESCILEEEEIEPLELVDFTPERSQQNVNYHEPEITLSFNEAVRLDSLEAAFSLYTRDANHRRIDIEGTIEERGQTEYAFLPDHALPDASWFELHIGDGVVSLDGDRRLAAKTWRFATMVNPSRGAEEDENDIRLDAYQTMRNAPLLSGKRTLLRATPFWRHREEIHENWRVKSFPAVIEADIGVLRIAAQFGENISSDRQLDVHHIDQFDDGDRRFAVDTINLFGWYPDNDESVSRATIRLEPHDPWPRPLDEAVFESTEEFENWPATPTTLDVRYVFLEAGDWSDGVPPEVEQHALSTLRLAEELSTQIFPVASTRMSPLQIPGIEGRIWRDFLFMDYDEYQDSWLDRRLYDDLWELNEKMGTRIPPEAQRRTKNVIRRAIARLRWLVELHAVSADMILVLYPDDVGVIGRVMNVGDFFWHEDDERSEDDGGPPDDPEKRFQAIKSRGIGMMIMDYVPADELATGIVHEMGHAFGLVHNPTHRSKLDGATPERHHDADIEGFRLTADGRDGWNKSGTYGNAEVPALAPLMWPQTLPRSWVWLNSMEYRFLQDAFANR